jgi:hypothetical protein
MMITIRSVIQQSHPRNRRDGIDQRLNSRLAAAFAEIRHTFYDPIHRVPSLYNKKAGGLMHILRLPLTSPDHCAYYLVFLTNAL